VRIVSRLRESIGVSVLMAVDLNKVHDYLHAAATKRQPYRGNP
jgi:hypothetical protein